MITFSLARSYEAQEPGAGTSLELMVALLIAFVLLGSLTSNPKCSRCTFYSSKAQGARKIAANNDACAFLQTEGTFVEVLQMREFANNYVSSYFIMRSVNYLTFGQSYK